MESRWCKSNRFALFLTVLAVLSFLYVATTYLDIIDTTTLDNLKKIKLSTSFFTDLTGISANVTARHPKFSTSQSSTRTTRITTVVTTKPTPTPTQNTFQKSNSSKPVKLESGEELLSVRSDKNYPSYVKLDVLNASSLAELKEKSSKQSFDKPSVARVIHQSWKVKSLPPRFVKWSGTWRKYFPDYEYKLWTDADNNMLVKNYFPWFFDRYNRLTHPVQKADAVRYIYLFTHGGIYADLDDECLNNFEHLLKNYSVVFGAMGGKWFPPTHPSYLKEGYVQNSFMYSVPGHPFWLEVLDTIMKRPPSSSAESTTGPFMLQEVIARWRKQNSAREQNEMHIYEPKYFNPFSWITKSYRRCKDAGRMTSRDIAACKAHFKDAYVIQYHTQTWGRGAANINKRLYEPYNASLTTPKLIYKEAMNL